MNAYLAAGLDLDSTELSAEDMSLTFVDNAEYEFVGGGAAATNGY